MAISETRLRISLIDKVTSPLQGMSSTFQKTMNSFASGGKSISAYTANIDKAASSLEKTNQMLQRLTYSAARYAIIYKGIVSIGNIWDEYVGGAYRYAKGLETNKIGIAGILSSMVKLNGQQLTWNQAMQISTQSMKELQSEALRTAATSDELIETFRALLGPGMGAGMSINQIMNLSTVGTNAVKSMGLPKNQIIQELRDLVQGGIRPASSTLATSLGLTDADIKAAKQSSEGLYKFLMDRLKGFSESVHHTSNSVAGRIARIQEGMQVGLSQAGEKLFEEWSDTLEDIAGELIVVTKINDKLEKWEINPEFKKSVSVVGDRLAQMAKDTKEVGKAAYPLGKAALKPLVSAIDLGSKNLHIILGGLLASKVAKYASDIANITVQTRENYTAETKLGEVIQGVNDRLTGRRAIVEALKQSASAFNATAAEYSSQMAEWRSVNTVLENSANGVHNLAKQWEAVGLNAEHAKFVISAIKHGKFVEADKAVSTINRMAVMKRIDKEKERIVAESAKGILDSGKTVAAQLAVQRKAYMEVAGGKRSEQSVTRLAEFYKKMGIEAKTAGEMQKKVQDLIIAGSQKVAEQTLKQYEAIAIESKRALEIKKATANAYDEEFAKLQKLAAGHRQVEYYKRNVNAFLNRKDTTDKQRVAVNALIKDLQRLGLEERQAYKMARLYTDELKAGRTVSAAAIREEILASAKHIHAIKKTTEARKDLVKITKEWQTVDYKKMTAEQAKLLAFDSERILKLSTQKEQVLAVRNAYKVLSEAEKEGILTSEQAGQARLVMRKQLATGYVDVAAQMSKEIELQYKQGTLAESTATKIIAAKQREIAERKRLLGLSEHEITVEQQKMLEYEALRNVSLVGNAQVVKSLQNIIRKEHQLVASLKRRGLSTVEVTQQYKRALLELATAQDGVNVSSLKATEAILENGAAALQTKRTFSGLINKISGATIGLGILCDVLADNTDEQRAWIGEAGQWITQMGFVTMAVSSLITNLKGLKKAAIEAVLELRKVFRAEIAVKAARALGILAIPAAAAYISYERNKGIFDQEGMEGLIADLKARDSEFAEAYDNMKGKIPFHPYEPKKKEDKEEEKKEQEKEIDTNQLSLIHPPELEESKSGRSGSGRDPVVVYARNLKKLSDLTMELNRKTLEETAGKQEIAFARVLEDKTKLMNELADIEKTIAETQTEKEVAESKKKIDQIKSLWNEYERVREKNINRQADKEAYEREMAHINNLKETYMLTTKQVKDLRLKALEERHKQLMVEMEDTTLNAERRLEIETEMANIRKQIEQENIDNFVKGWESALREIAHRQQDFKGTVLQIFDTIESAGTDFIVEAGTFSEKLKKFSRDVTNSIMRDMTRLFMNGLISRFLGGLGGNTPPNISWGTPISARATGGSVGANSFALVGERGPELVQFNRAGRVFPAAETKSMLKGGTPPIKLVIKNESGTPVKAEQTGSQFDGEEWVLSVVLKGVSENKYGLRTILQGAR